MMEIALYQSQENFPSGRSPENPLVTFGLQGLASWRYKDQKNKILPINQFPYLEMLKGIGMISEENLIAHVAIPYSIPEKMFFERGCPAVEISDAATVHWNGLPRTVRSGRASIIVIIPAWSPYESGIGEDDDTAIFWAQYFKQRIADRLAQISYQGALSA